uniref:Chloride channel K n=1 Tax=Anabas testudineus TaxID=64144 RepID=A0A7N6BKS2_ANATE
MKSVECESETDIESNKQEGGNQSNTSQTKSLLLSDEWKPYLRPRTILRCCFGAVCGLEWYGFAALGILTAFLSFLMDFSVLKLLKAHQWLYMKLDNNSLLQFLCWTLYPVCLCVVGSTFSHNICPYSTGSGIPEVRTILVGFEMPHYLSVTHLFTKYVGLICTLAAGSTIFLGKVGPFVHLSTMVGAYLSNLCSLIQTKHRDNASREMLVVAAGVGVASCFGAPISGVLFSVEVMSSHFALRQYVPCFLSAACGGLTFRLFSMWSGDEETLQVLFKTNFPTAIPFYPLEILLFAFLGKGLYAGMVAFLLACVTFPHFAGQYMASKYTMKQLLTSLMDSRQWGSQTHNASVQLEPEPWFEWISTGNPFYFSLTFFLLMKMWMLVLACTLPVPAGYFMPVFVYGAALGRLVGDGAAHMFSLTSINPGGYALAGAAAYSGAVTHTLSPALLAVEVTGQYSHAVPALVATLLANGVARSRHRPSFYDALSIGKRLPHLPSLKKTIEKHLDEVCCIHPISVLSVASNPVSYVLLQAYSILSLVGAQTLFVADGGRLVGLLTWPEMKRILEDLTKEI